MHLPVPDIRPIDRSRPTIAAKAGHLYLSQDERAIPAILPPAACWPVRLQDLFLAEETLLPKGPWRRRGEGETPPRSKFAVADGRREVAYVGYTIGQTLAPSSLRPTPVAPGSPFR